MSLLHFLLRSSLMQNSNRDISIMFSLFATPAVVTNFFKASGVYPLLLSPEIVGILGSSHPETYPFSTSESNFLLDVMVWLRLSLANSLCFGLIFFGSTTRSKNQSYKSLCGLNSRVHKECETCSI